MTSRIVWRGALSAALLLGIGAVGCAPYESEYGVGAEITYIDRGPPRSLVEVRGAVPGPGYTWIGGYWRWTGGDYDWMPGRWVRVQRGYRSWSPGHWRHSRRGWFWVEGRWH